MSDDTQAPGDLDNESGLVPAELESPPPAGVTIRQARSSDAPSYSRMWTAVVAEGRWVRTEQVGDLKAMRRSMPQAFNALFAQADKGAAAGDPAQAALSRAVITPLRDKLDRVEVPAENVLGEVNRGAQVLMSGLDFERAVLSGGPIGLMQACMDVVLPYVHQREQFGQPIGEFQLMQGKLADMYSTMNACKAYVYAVGGACDRARTPDAIRALRKDAAAAVLFAGEKATWMAGEAIQALGGNGYINEYPTGRLWRDAKLYEIGAGTSEIRRWLIGRELFDETK